MKVLLTTVLVGLALSALSLLFPAVMAPPPEYVEITGRGDSMYPAIADGDTVLVEMFTNVSSIKQGDIIVYGSIAALAWNPNPSSIWISHRVTEVYMKEGQLCFRTKGDNNPEVDPWEVPAYWVTGKVLSVSHTGHPPQTTETSPADQPAAQPLAYNIGDLWFYALVGVGAVAIYILKTLDDRKKL